MAAVFDEELVHVHDVPGNGAVIGAPAERDQGAGNDVGEAPGELAKRGGVALTRQRIRDAGRDLGDARKLPDRVVAGGHLRVAEMKQIEPIGAPRAPRFRIDALQELRIALGVEHDHHIAAADVLGDEKLGEPRLADARRADDERVPDAPAEVHPHRLLAGLDPVQPRIAPERGQRAQRIPPGALSAAARASHVQARPRFPRDLLAPCQAIEPPGLGVAARLGALGVSQALGVQRRPAKAAPEKELVAAHRNARGAQPVLGQAAQTPAVAQHPQSLSGAPEREEREQACGAIARRGRHQERGRRHCGGKRRAGSDERAPELDRRAAAAPPGDSGRSWQASRRALKSAGGTAHCSMRLRVTSTG